MLDYQSVSSMPSQPSPPEVSEISTQPEAPSFGDTTTHPFWDLTVEPDQWILEIKEAWLQDEKTSVVIFIIPMYNNKISGLCRCLLSQKSNSRIQELISLQFRLTIHSPVEQCLKASVNLSIKKYCLVYRYSRNGSYY